MCQRNPDDWIGLVLTTTRYKCVSISVSIPSSVSVSASVSVSRSLRRLCAWLPFCPDRERNVFFCFSSFVFRFGRFRLRRSRSGVARSFGRRSYHMAISEAAFVGCEIAGSINFQKRALASANGYTETELHFEIGEEARELVKTG